MGDDFHIIANPMLTLDEYYSKIDKEEAIDGDDMYYDEVIKVEMQLTSPRSGI